ncbi:hypothetical protein APS56_10195 [Pseudalgibacter alginicilyticus]|uniref:3-keto-alpha-glucoside-1,2-lyase/3-keto-2-hydroxy-glucal hydratase domain-containing protein n=1 Tax=Pseudalgibacter alginicilyticus TaxID=1736674 RepID=A0A0P0D5R7_9FLAO|nr:DUF1080 domain-containing protein [Pseudalgibacter alginicilyticus]ALJ05465.1 hypothetical protein APS56_10195 [Pseudalgibacter alginicilyticus]
MNIKLSFLIILISLINTNTFAQKEGKPILLFDKDLSNFDIWLSIPHSTVEDLPEDTYQSDKINSGTPIGLNNNLKNVFSMIEENSEPVLKITGEIFGGLTTKEAYENYHLSVMFKWGDKKWEPRLDKKRDSGILYHCYGPHGRFWNTWKTSLEYQVQENDLGDFIPLGGNSGNPKVGAPIVDIRGHFKKEKKFNPYSEVYSVGKGYIHASSEHDAPHGEWNRLEIYVLDNNAVHLVNGKIVMVVENAKKHDGSILNKGEIQIQSEAAECYYKKLTLTPIKKFPKFIKKQVRFK